MKKLSNTKVELKKLVGFKKACSYKILTDVWTDCFKSNVNNSALIVNAYDNNLRPLVITIKKIVVIIYK